jgi:hypothetical protein
MTGAFILLTSVSTIMNTFDSIMLKMGLVVVAVIYVNYDPVIVTFDSLVSSMG